MSQPELKTKTAANRTPQTLTPRSARSPAPPSLWLYLAGLCVTLSGLYAVWADVVDAGVYRGATFLLAAAGCGFSYMARRLQIPTRSLRVTAALGISALFLFALTTRHGLDALLPADALLDRSKACLILIAWGATLLTFLLNSDAAVLFSCVPSMSMIALVTTLTPDAQMRSVFLVFVGAATFLMVHENYLRTQNGAPTEKTDTAQKMLRGQMQLAALCVAGSLTLAMLAVIPIRLVGQQLFLPTATALRNGPGPFRSLATLNGGIEHSDALDIATGPVAPGDQPVMRVKSKAALYWRGATFDRYTGSSFINSSFRHREATMLLYPTTQANDLPKPGEAQSAQQMAGDTPSSRFDIPDSLSLLELPDAEMRHSREIVETITLEDERARQIYGAGRIKQVWLSDDQLAYNMAGSLTMTTGQPLGCVYRVVSRVADDNPANLRAASSRPDDIPALMGRRYLRIDKNNAWLRELAAQITQGSANHYDAAIAIQNYIGENCNYNLQAPRAPRDRDIVEHFLRVSHEGYCDSFAAAMTMLCRYAGVPARLATGFVTGDYDPETREYVVREKHRHAWTEVFFPNIGWVSFDATSSASDISEYPAKQGKKPQSFLKWLLSSGGTPLAAALACVIIVGFVLRKELRVERVPGEKRIRRRFVRRAKDGREIRAVRDRKIASAYAAACLALKRRGAAGTSALTPDEYAAQVQEKFGAELPEILPPFQVLTALCVASRYGSRPLTDAEANQAKSAAAQVVASLRRAKQTKPTTKPEPAEKTTEKAASA